VKHGRHTARPARLALWVSVVVFVVWWLAAMITIVNAWVVWNFGQLELPQFIYHIVNIVEVIKPMSIDFWTATVFSDGGPS